MEIDFSELKKLDYALSSKEQATIKTRIESLEEAKMPSQKQIETVHFILENQLEIIKAIFVCNQRYIYPIYEASIDIEEDETVHDLSQLSRVYGINAIEIPKVSKSDSFYYLIQFNFRYDDEHGLYFLFENTTVIDFFGEGDKRNDAIFIYQNGLKNKNEEPLAINIYKVPSLSVLKRTCYFDEEIEFPLEKGAYRIAVKCNEQQYSINFYTGSDLEKFSLKQTLLMK